MTETVLEITDLPAETGVRFNKKFALIATATTVAVVGAVYFVKKLAQSDEDSDSTES